MKEEQNIKIENLVRISTLRDVQIKLYALNLDNPIHNRIIKLLEELEEDYKKVRND